MLIWLHKEYKPGTEVQRYKYHQAICIYLHFIYTISKFYSYISYFHCGTRWVVLLCGETCSLRLTTCHGSHVAINTRKIKSNLSSPRLWGSNREAVWVEIPATSLQCKSQRCKRLHSFLLREEGGGDNVDMVLLSCVHLLPSHFAKDHSINKRICWKF